MKNFSLITAEKILTVFTILAIFLLTSCGKMPSTAPDMSSSTGDINIVGLNGGQDLTLQGGLKAQEKIGPDGGTVEIPGYVRIVIPAGAMAKKKKVKITIPHPDEFSWELEPHGYEFAVPVQLTVFTENADSESADDDGWSDSGMDIYWEASSGWIPQNAAYDEDESAFEVDLEHFSRYALATD